MASWLASSFRWFPLALLLGCHGDAAPCALTARPRAAATGFDANSDGVLDVADGAWLLARNMRGGEDPPCLAAVEAYGDAVNDSATAYASWYALIAGTAVPSLPAGACPAPEPEEAVCGDGAAFSLQAPASVQGSVEFSAEVQLISPTLPVEAWSVSVAASGCTVVDASLAGTLGADRRDSPPGARDGGLGHAALGDGGAVSLVVLDPIGGGTVRPGSPTSVLALRVRAEVGGSCGSCRLSLEDGQQGAGRPLTNTVSSGGRSYGLAGAEVEVEVCPE